MTEVLDVAHLAARQMRAARLLHAALEELRALNIGDNAYGVRPVDWLEPRSAHHARAAATREVVRLKAEHKAALDAYNAACDAIDLHPHADQPALFDTPEGA